MLLTISLPSLITLIHGSILSSEVEKDAVN